MRHILCIVDTDKININGDRYYTAHGIEIRKGNL